MTGVALARTRARRGAPALAVLACLALACGGPGAGDRPSPADTTPLPGRDGGDGAGAPGAADPARDLPAPDPADPGGAPPDTVVGEGRWTAATVALGPALDARMATATDVRAAAHAGYDRIAWTFDDDRPGVRVRYVDEPVRACGSGRPVPLAGDGWLEVRFEPARAHDEAGSATLPDRLAPRLATLLEGARTCDFEGVLVWTFGVASPEPFRVHALEDPPRVAVDVRHPGR